MSDPAPSTPPPRRYFSAGPPSDAPAVHKIAHAIKPHAQLWDSVKKLAVAVVAVGTLLVTGFVWAVKIVVRGEIEELRRQMDPIAMRQVNLDGKALPSISDRFDSLKSDLGQIKMSIGSSEDPQSKLGKRLDSLDKILEKQFGESTMTTPPPVVGPSAKKQGR